MNAFTRALVDLEKPRPSRAEYVTIEEAAEMLNRSVRTLRYWQKAGRMPKQRRFSKRLLYLRTDIEEFGLIHDLF